MRDDLNKGGNLVSVQEAARLKKRIGREPGKTRRGIGIKLEDRTETNLGEFNADEHSRMLTEIERLRDKRLIKGSANRKKRGPTDFEREVEAYLRVCALSDINNTQRPQPPRLVQVRYQGRELKMWLKNIFRTEQYWNLRNSIRKSLRVNGSDRIRSGRKG
jgi:hypothetical protein